MADVSTSNQKQVNAWRRLAKKQGWVVTRRQGGHEKWTAPDGRVLIVAPTIGRGRALENMRAQMRRAGLDVDRRPAGRKARRAG